MGSRMEPIEKYNQFFINSKKVPAFDSLTFSQNKINEDHYFGLFNDDNLISVLHIELRELPYYQITYSQTERNFQRQGCFRYLLDYAVSMYSNIVSDSRQTKEAASAWVSLSLYPSGKTNYYIYDTDNGRTEKITYKNHESIWNSNDNPVILASKVKHPDNIQEKLDRSNELKKRHKRDHDSLFYGKYAIWDDYENP